MVQMKGNKFMHGRPKGSSRLDDWQGQNRGVKYEESKEKGDKMHNEQHFNESWRRLREAGDKLANSLQVAFNEIDAHLSLQM